jgi:hypothetical protein
MMILIDHRLRHRASIGFAHHIYGIIDQWVLPVPVLYEWGSFCLAVVTSLQFTMQYDRPVKDPMTPRSGANEGPAL